MSDANDGSEARETDVSRKLRGRLLDHPSPDVAADQSASETVSRCLACETTTASSGYCPDCLDGSLTVPTAVVVLATFVVGFALVLRPGPLLGSLLVTLVISLAVNWR